jgi:hypothetical protein
MQLTGVSNYERTHLRSQALLWVVRPSSFNIVKAADEEKRVCQNEGCSRNTKAANKSFENVAKLTFGNDSEA